MKAFIKSYRSSIIALSVLLIIFISLVLLPFDQSAFQKSFSDICRYTRPYVGLFTLIGFIAIIFFSFTKYGKIRLGGPDAKTEYSTFSWLACLFMAGCGIGIVFYNQESVLHLHNNPYFGNVCGSKEAVAYSLTLFNWTLNSWAPFAILGLIIAYFHFNKGKELKLSSALPSRTPSWIKTSIDVILALGVIAGLTTSLGLGVTQIRSGLFYAFDWNVSPYVLIAVIGSVAAASVISGLQRGVKWLSNISLILVSILVLIVLGIGLFHLNQTGFLSYIGNGVGTFLRNYFKYNDVFNPESAEWAAAWPVFYQLWFASWAAFVAVFVAKISKGRTIREFTWGVIGFPTLFTIIWFGIFGRVGLEYDSSIYEAMSSDISTAVFVFLRDILGSEAFMSLSLLIIIVICLFFITSADSGAFVVATLLADQREPKAKDKILWSGMLCISAMVLYWCGGLSLIQSASVIMGLLVIALIIGGTVYFVYRIVKDYKEN